MKPNVATEPRRAAGNQLGWGISCIFAGQIVFVVCGYVLHAYLARMVEPAAYGLYGVTMTLLNWAENVLNSGVAWAMRKSLAANPRASRQILRNGLASQALVAGMLYGGSMILAPRLTGAMQDPALIFYLRIALTDILIMAIYTLLRGTLNGLRDFLGQAVTIVAYAGSKLIAGLILLQLGFGLVGALVGNILGTFGGAAVGLWLVRRRVIGLSLTEAATGEVPGRYDSISLLKLALPMVLFTLTSSFLSSIGVLGVKSLVTDGDQVGFYSSAHLLATAPSWVLTAFSLTMFPHIARSIARREWFETRSYVRETIRYLAIVMAPAITIVLAASPRLIRLVYPQPYVVAAPLLNLLFVGTATHTLYVIFSNVILAEGRTLLALAIPVGLVPISAVSTWLLTLQLGTRGAAMTVVLVELLALAAAAAYSARRFRIAPDWLSLARVSAASGAVYALVRFVDVRGVALVGYLAMVGVIYLALLFLLREFDARATWSQGMAVAARVRKRGQARI